MGTIVRAMSRGDLEAIMPQEHDADLSGATPGFINRLVEQGALGESVTIVCDGEPVCCGGVMNLWPGVAEGWLYVSRSVHRHRLAFHRSVWSVMLQICENQGIWRLQATVPESNARACRWIKRLGFVEEGTMPMYGPDRSTFVRYALFPWGGE